MGAVIIPLLLGVGGTDWPAAALVGAGFGLVVGGATGALSGVVLALVDAENEAGLLRLRAAGAFSAMSPFLVGAAVLSDAGWRASVYCLLLGLISGIAGGLLAIRVTRGKRY